MAPIHVTTPRNVASRPGAVVHRTRHLDHCGPLLVTDRVRTLVDLADHLMYPELRAVADELPELPKQRLIATSARLPGRAGVGRTKLLIHSEDARTRFALERRYVRYCTHYALPHPDGRNVRVHGFPR